MADSGVDMAQFLLPRRFRQPGSQVLPRPKTSYYAAPIPNESSAVIRARFLLTVAAVLLPVVSGADTPACPAGTQPSGAAPPAAYEWKCVTADGVAEGPWLTWYASGQLLSERHMKRGREHGRQRSWWPNGQLMMDGVSVEGHRYQGFKYWTITGEPTRIEVQAEPVVQPAPDRPRAKNVQ
jgi:hypothetical protein